MRIRTARAILQRLALVAGLAAGAWCAAEGLDHGTAWANDPPIRIEQEATEQPGGLLDDSPSRTPDTDTEQPPAEPTPDDDPGTGSDDEQTAEPDRPRNDGDAGEEVGSPDPTDGDTGPQPGDTPSDPGPTDPPPPPGPPDTELPGNPGPPRDETPNTGQPVDEEPLPDTPPVNEEPAPEEPETVPPAGGDLEADHPPFGGGHQPAPYVPIDVQTEPSKGGQVCDSRDDRGTPVADDRPGTRDRVGAPRHLPGPGPILNACDLTAAGGRGGAPPLLKPPNNDPLPGAPPADPWPPQPDRPHPGADRHNDAVPPSRLTLWPPGPG